MPFGIRKANWNFRLAFLMGRAAQNLSVARFGSHRNESVQPNQWIINPEM